MYVPTHLSTQTKNQLHGDITRLTAVWKQTENFNFHERLMKCVCSSVFSPADEQCEDKCVLFSDFVFTLVAYFCFSMRHNVPRHILGGFN